MTGSDEISEAGRRQRFERWEALGLDRVKQDLVDGGHRLVGGPPQVRELAWEWVRIKEAERDEAAKKPGEAVTLKPGLYGVSVDLKELSRRALRRFRKL